MTEESTEDIGKKLVNLEDLKAIQDITDESIAELDKYKILHGTGTINLNSTNNTLEKWYNKGSWYGYVVLGSLEGTLFNTVSPATQYGEVVGTQLTTYTAYAISQFFNGRRYLHDVTEEIDGQIVMRSVYENVIYARSGIYDPTSTRKTMWYGDQDHDGWCKITTTQIQNG